MQILNRRTNNPCLIGEPRVGKTGHRRGNSPGLKQAGAAQPLDKEIWLLDLTALVAGLAVKAGSRAWWKMSRRLAM